MLGPMSGQDTFRRELGQLLWIGFEGTALSRELASEIAAGQWGGVTLFRRNLVYRDGEPPVLESEPLVDLNDSLHSAIAAGEAPLLISVDQEGGRVQRARAPAVRWPPMAAIEATGARAAELARRIGNAVGTELDALDFDVDFAPVLDVNSNPENPIIGDRSFSADPEKAAELALAFAEGLAAAGLVSCGKHFPGHGDTVTDSHLALPRIDRDRASLEAIELAPFRKAAEARLPMLMTAHVIFAALDDQLPATLSPKVVDGLLRKDIGYAGVVVSDDLDMKAVADHYGIGEAAERAILAGCDVLLLCRDRNHQLEAYENLIRAAESNSTLRDRIRESARRVHHLKRDHFRAKANRKRPGVDVLGTFQSLADDVERAASAASI